MIQKSLITFLFLLTSSTFACEISLPQNILKLKENINLSDWPIKTNCSKDLIKKISKKISSLEGKILSLSFAPKGVTIGPHSISIKRLEELLNEKYEVPHQKFFNAETLTNKSYLDLDIPYSLNCLSCNEPGNKRISLNQQNKLIILTAKLKVLKNYFVTKRPIKANEKNLEEKDFIQKEGYVDGNKKLFNPKEDIRFFKTTKFIKEGEVLLDNMFYLKNLVNTGSKVQVLFSTDDISIKSILKSQESGKLGDQIVLINEKSNKKITATIIDENKAVINL